MNLTRTFIAWVLFSIFVLNCADASAQEDVKLDFAPLASGTYSRYEGTRKVELIIDEATWRRVWLTLDAKRAAPEVDFALRSVIVVWQGQQTRGGYSINVRNVRRDKAGLIVEADERAPAPDAITTQVITSPFAAISIPRQQQGGNLTVRFSGEENRNSASPIKEKKVKEKQSAPRRSPLRRRPPRRSR